MKNSFHIKIIQVLIISILIFHGCGELVSYPDVPQVTYKGFNLYLTEDILGNKILLAKLEIEFIDGNGDIGIKQSTEDELPDSLKYNLFLSLFKIENDEAVKVEGSEGELKYRLPFIERIGQNKTLKGTIYVDIEYKTIEYDTIFYTFYLIDREFNKSNTDTTELIVLPDFEP